MWEPIMKFFKRAVIYLPLKEDARSFHPSTKTACWTHDLLLECLVVYGPEIPLCPWRITIQELLNTRLRVDPNNVCSTLVTTPYHNSIGSGRVDSCIMTR